MCQRLEAVRDGYLTACTESSNLAALETWVRETLPQFEEECGRAVLPYLLERLERTLHQWGAA
jgi:hypothetical protein